jgi:hypothetical protein
MIQPCWNHLRGSRKDSQLIFGYSDAAAVFDKPSHLYVTQLDFHCCVDGHGSGGGHAKANGRNIKDPHGGYVANAPEHGEFVDGVSRLRPSFRLLSLFDAKHFLPKVSTRARYWAMVSSYSRDITFGS